MGERVRQLVWFCVVASVVAYSTYLFVGSATNTADPNSSQTVTVHDAIEPGVHRLYGLVMVPSPCDQVSVRAETGDAQMYVLVFQTWHVEAAATCPPEATPREFNAVVEAPAAGVRFVATLNGKSIPISLEPSIAGHQ